MVPFSRRELTRAWKYSHSTSKAAIRTDAHRLLLFYSVECGLKAVQLRQLNLDVIDANTAREHSHDLNSLLTVLRLGKENHLPLVLKLTPLKAKDGTEIARNFAIGALNQIWRYGGALTSAENSLLEATLEKINVWIAKEIQ